MGNNVTTTNVESVQINNEDNAESNWNNNNNFNGTSDHDYPQYKQSDNFEPNNEKSEWDCYENEQYTEPEESINDRIRKASFQTSHSVESKELPTVPDYSDESDDVVSDMKDSKLFNELNDRRTPLTRSQTVTKDGLPLVIRSVDGENDNIREIDELDSIESGSKLTLNDVKSDTEEVIQELNKLIFETDEKEFSTHSRFRRRGQSWSNCDNNVNVELNAESSLSSFSRPASNSEKDLIKPKSFTAPETRGQIDSAIEWLAKQHGLDIGSSLEFDRHNTYDSNNSKHVLRISSVEIPGAVSSSSTPGPNDNELQFKYDELDEKLINSIESDYSR